MYPLLKGTGSPAGYILKAEKTLNQYLLYVLMVLKILDCLVGEKVKYKDFENTFYCNSKICTESCNSIFVQLLFSLIGGFSPGAGDLSLIG